MDLGMVHGERVWEWGEVVSWKGKQAESGGVAILFPGETQVRTAGVDVHPLWMGPTCQWLWWFLFFEYWITEKWCLSSVLKTEKNDWNHFPSKRIRLIDVTLFWLVAAHGKKNYFIKVGEKMNVFSQMKQSLARKHLRGRKAKQMTWFPSDSLMFFWNLHWNISEGLKNPELFWGNLIYNHNLSSSHNFCESLCLFHMNQHFIWLIYWG